MDCTAKWWTMQHLRRGVRAIDGRLYVGWGVFAFLWPQTVARLCEIRRTMQSDDRMVVAVLTGQAVPQALRPRVRQVPLRVRRILAAGLRDVDGVIVWRTLEPDRWARTIGHRKIAWMGPLEPLQW